MQDVPGRIVRGFIICPCAVRSFRFRRELPNIYPTMPLPGVHTLSVKFLIAQDKRIRPRFLESFVLRQRANDQDVTESEYVLLVW